MPEHLKEQILDALADTAIVELDAAGSIVNWSGGARRIFGWSAAEVVDRSFAVVFTGEDCAAGLPRTLIERAIAGRVDDQRWHVRNDGRRLHLTESLRPLVDLRGRCTGFLFVAHDDTERRFVDQRLSMGEASLRLATDAAEIGTWDLDLTTDVLTWSDRTYAMFGISPAAPVDIRDFYAGLHPDDLAATTAAFASALDPAVRATYDVVFRTLGKEDGVVRWVAAKGRGLFDEAGRCIRAIGTAIDTTRTRQAETALREAQALNASILDSSRDCIVVLDLEARNLFVSKGGIESMEIADVDAIIGLSWLRLWQGADLDAATAAVDEARRGGIGRFQGYCPTHRGKPKWWDVVISPLRGSDGRPERLVSVGRDITEVRQVELRQDFLLRLTDSLRIQTSPQDLMATAIEALGRHLHASRVGFAQLEPDDLHFSVRHSHVDGVPLLTGVFPLAGLGRDHVARQRRGETVICHDVDAEREEGAIWGAIQVRAFVSVPLIRHGRFGASMFVHDREPRTWTPDQVALIAEVASRSWDAVERARAEAALRSLNETLEQQVLERTRERDRAWNNSQDLLAVVDADGVFRAANPAWTTILGWRPDEVVGHSHIEFIHPDDRSGSEVARERAATEGLPRHENRYRHQDGTWRWISWVASPEGELVYASGRHITAEKEAAIELAAAQEKLRQSQKMEAVGQLTGGLAHDFNNLLTGILGSLELLQLRISKGRFDRIDHYVETAQASARRAAALTHRLLAFSRRQTLDPKPVHIDRLIADMEELIRRTAGPQIAVEVIEEAGPWQALVDANQLENALLNLCINARDAMPDGGRLTIRTDHQWLADRAARDRELAPGHYVCLSVIDTGTGMSDEVIERAFDPFFTTKPIGSGTGLGLSMVYGFARQSGGTVRIDSGVGRGTTMSLYLPQHDGGTGEPAGPVQASATPRAERGETVLVIDDEPSIRMLVAEVLADFGYAAIEAGDGASGLAILQSGRHIDLLITDVGLPGGMNGRQVADAARSLRPGLKVLFITGYAEKAALGGDHLEAGMAVLSKPFAVETLALRIEELITEGRA